MIIEERPYGVLLSVQSLKMHFMHELQALITETDLSSSERSVQALEIWSM